MIFMSMMSLKDAQGCKIPEYPHAARQPPVRPLPTSGFSNLTIFLGSWLMIILFQVLQCCGWFCFMMNRRRLSSSSSLSFSSSLPFFDFLLLQRNSGDRLRKSRRASTRIGGFRGTFTQRQSACNTKLLFSGLKLVETFSRRASSSTTEGPKALWSRELPARWSRKHLLPRLSIHNIQK